jgi:hypothetical protein
MRNPKKSKSGGMIHDGTRSLAGAPKEGCGSKRAVLPMMMIK